MQKNIVVCCDIPDKSCGWLRRTSLSNFHNSELTLIVDIVRVFFVSRFIGWFSFYQYCIWFTYYEYQVYLLPVPSLLITSIFYLLSVFELLILSKRFYEKIVTS